ncbi:MAG: CapA family protein [Bacteroidales bacterium]|nr:CapA family protein [Bacteroidales bacterium]
MMRILLFLLAQSLFWGTCGLWSSNWFGNKRPVEVVHEEPTPDTLTLMFIGDVMSHMPQVDAARLPDGTYDYAPCYRFLAPYIASADICIANMEVPLAGAPYSGYPQFSCPDAMMSQLFDAGVDVFLTANNHTCDKGAKGIRRTIQVMDSLGIPHVGTYLDSTDFQQRNPLMVERDGFRVAVLNYTYGTNGIPAPNPFIVNMLDSAAIARDIARARELKADYIVVMPHWGIEYERKQNKGQKGYANYMYECGADMIIGGHPHVVQPITLENKNEYGVAQRVTAYSLGNFVSNQRKRYTDGGIIVKCEIVRDTNGTMRVTNYEYLPYWVYKGVCQGKYQYHILPAKHAVENCAYYNIHGADSVALNLFYNDTKSLIDNVPESRFDFQFQ